jgi:O-antigen/teichoic acid export membrane protein
MTRATTTVRGLRLPTAGVVGQVLRDPLLRNGYALTVSSAATSLLGLAYWALAARLYSAADVGRNSAAISVMMFLAGVAQLNLMSALMRFLPVAGRRAGRLVRGAYVVGVLMAVVVSTGFLALAGTVAPNLTFLRSGPLVAAGFVAATAGYTIFVLQDSVLTGLRRAVLVPVENGWFGLTKIVLLVLLAAALPATGIFASWGYALVLTVVPTTWYLARRAIPRHERAAAADAPLPVRQISGYVAFDYVGSLCWLAAINLVPLLVLAALGAAANAYFALAWVIAYSLYMVGSNMGASFVVETAADPSTLERRWWALVGHTLRVMVPLSVFVAAAAPYLLQVFGRQYGAAGAGVLRLLALSAIPNVITALAVSAARAQRRMRLVVAVLLAICALVLTVTAALLPVLGLPGVGVAWLLAQTLVAGVLLLTRRRWLSPAVPAAGSVTARATQPR